MTVCHPELQFNFLSDRPVVVKVSDLELSSDAGILLARQAEEQVQVCRTIDSCIEDWREPNKITHSLEQLVSQRVYQMVDGIALTRIRDIIVAPGGNDTISGSFANLLQNDTIRGGLGRDTIVITDGTSSDALNIDLTNTSTQITNLPGTVVRGFESFDLGAFNGSINFRGNAGNNTVLGGQGNDSMNGRGGSDSLSGGNGVDLLTGADVSTFGVDEIDILAGGAGSDRFILASSAGTYYNDGNNLSSGLGDYAVIQDFSKGDVIQLQQGISYVLGSTPNSTGLGGTGIYIDNDGVAGLSSNDELIGVLQGVTLSGPISSNRPGFSFV
jgi:Transposase DDE domain group 1/RTX calcium-binding nonapeptide repeat (4 copies)